MHLNFDIDEKSTSVRASARHRSCMRSILISKLLWNTSTKTMAENILRNASRVPIQAPEFSFHFLRSKNLENVIYNDIISILLQYKYNSILIARRFFSSILQILKMRPSAFKRGYFREDFRKISLKSKIQFSRHYISSKMIEMIVSYVLIACFARQFIW